MPVLECQMGWLAGGSKIPLVPINRELFRYVMVPLRYHVTK